jgi:hypothetical protein
MARKTIQNPKTYVSAKADCAMFYFFFVSSKNSCPYETFFFLHEKGEVIETVVVSAARDGCWPG